MVTRQTSLAPILWEALCRLADDNIAASYGGWPLELYTCLAVSSAAVYKAREKGAYTHRQRRDLAMNAVKMYRNSVAAGSNRVGFKVSSGHYCHGNKGEKQALRAQMLYLAYLQAKDQKLMVVF